MAKQITQCPCGGSFDGTPSGKSKHIATAKHVGYEVGQRKAAKAPIAEVTVAGVEQPATVNDAIAAGVAQPLPVKARVSGEADAIVRDELADALHGIITSREQELARRQIDYKYRARNVSAEAASDYFAAKVEPLAGEVAILRSVFARLAGQ